jgi:hypothetical protein
MTDWSSVRAIPVGGLVVVGFLDEHRVVVGSHSGLDVFDAATGPLLDRVEDPDGGYAWFQESPPTALYTGDGEQSRVPVAGLWGGTLSSTTDDGWTCQIEDAGARLSGPEGSLIAVDDAEEPRACGFSPQGQVFVFATSPTLHVAVRAWI